MRLLACAERLEGVCAAAAQGDAVLAALGVRPCAPDSCQELGTPVGVCGCDADRHEMRAAVAGNPDVLTIAAGFDGLGQLGAVDLKVGGVVLDLAGYVPLHLFNELIGGKCFAHVVLLALLLATLCRLLWLEYTR